jgi:glycosyltransferase
MLKLSVVTVSHNSEDTIGNTIRSFLSQTFQNKELVLIDGASCDRTVEIVRSFESSLIRISSEPDAGVYDAMNKGLSLYTGDAVGFLNSDDAFHDNDALKKVATSLEVFDVVYGDIKIVLDHHTKRVWRDWQAGGFEKGAFRAGWMPPHPSFYARRSVVEKTGYFDLRYSIASDYDFMLRCMELGTARVGYIDSCLVDFLQGGKSSGRLLDILRANYEAYLSRRRHLGVSIVDPAIFLKPARKILQLASQSKK